LGTFFIFNNFFVMNNIVGIIFLLIYGYQVYFIFVSFLKTPKPFPEAAPRRYAILICARNESSVIGHLLDSIRDQDYPKDCLDVYVIADNCTDDTADISREKGAFVVERSDTSKIGKGYALEYLVDNISKGGTVWDYEGYFIIDSDNLLEKNFVSEMNKAVAAGNKVVTCYRNSKNYSDNWLASGYALWFLRDSKYLNNSRQILGFSSQCSGTGFVIHRDIFIKYGGWKYFTLTEDIEFTFAMVANNEHIAYCPTAVLYDEQPVDFGVSWKQRTRWVKGYFQAYNKYGIALLKGWFGRRDFSCYDMLANTFSGGLLTLALFVIYWVCIIYYAIAGLPMIEILPWFIQYAVSCYVGLIVVGAITTHTEWEKIYCPPMKKRFFIVTFPLFLFTLMPITLAAPFSRQRWPQVKHVRAVNIEDIQKTP